MVEAAGAEAASALVHTLDSLDLVITDVVMPGANGPTLAGHLRAERPASPVLFATGARGVDVRGRVQSAGSGGWWVSMQHEG